MKHEMKLKIKMFLDRILYKVVMFIVGNRVVVINANIVNGILTIPADVKGLVYNVSVYNGKAGVKIGNDGN